MIKGTCTGAVTVIYQMPFTEHKSIVPVFNQGFTYEAMLRLHPSAVGRKSEVIIGQISHACTMMVTTAHKAGTRGRTHCVYMKITVTQAVFSQPVYVRRIDQRTVTSDIRITGVIKQDIENVRGFSGSLFFLRPPGCGVYIMCFDSPIELLVGIGHKFPFFLWAPSPKNTLPLNYNLNFADQTN